MFRLISLVMLLATGCGGGASVSEGTQRLGATLTGEGDPEVAYGAAGEVAVLGDFSFQFDPPFQAPLNHAALVVGHRNDHKDNVTMVLPFKIRNDSSMALKPAFNRELYNLAGERVYAQGALTADIATQMERTNTGAGDKLKPGVWTDSVYVFAMPADEVGVSRMHLWQTETRTHPATGRKYEVTLHRSVVELGEMATTAPVTLEITSYDDAGGGLQMRRGSDGRRLRPSR